MKQTTKQRQDRSRRAVKAIPARRDARQRDRFVEEYVKDLNPIQAAIRAGYTRKSAHVTGCRLLEDPKVLAAVEQGKAKAAAAALVDREAWVREVSSLATTLVSSRFVTPRIKLAALNLKGRALRDMGSVVDRADDGEGVTILLPYKDNRDGSPSTAPTQPIVPGYINFYNPALGSPGPTGHRAPSLPTNGGPGETEA